MPFEPKMCLETDLDHSMKIAVGKVERELLEDYPRELAMLVMGKLKTIIKDLNFNTHKKSIAIYVSPAFEKVLYLDINVDEKIIVDESFEIRDLLYCKKQLRKYLVLLLSSKVSRIYLANSETFVRIVYNTAETVHAYDADIPGSAANFSDMPDRREIISEKFLHHVDNTLEIVLNAYHLPLFVIGTEKVLAHFKKLSQHTGNIIDYVIGNYEEATLQELKHVLEPNLTDWKKVVQKDLLNQLEKASNEKKLVMGMKDVWRDATSHKGRLLVVEKDYKYAAQQDDGDLIYRIDRSYNKFSYTRDVVDDVIEKVLEGGGDVEFVDKGVLKAYQQIALVKYY